MRMTFTTLATLGCAGWLIAAAPIAGRALQHPEGNHTHADAAKLQNPVPKDEASIAAGKTLYETHCVDCHGESGKGDGTMAPYVTPTPSDLTDGEWKHGSSDGELYTVIREGVDGTGMKDFKKEMSERQTWEVVNYVGTLGKP